MQRPVGAVRGAMNHPRQHLLAGAGLAGEQDRQRRRGDAPGDGQDLRRALRDPEALGVPFERLGRPQRGALLLVAAVAGRASAPCRPACGWRRGCSDDPARAAAGRGFARSRHGAGRATMKSSAAAPRAAAGPRPRSSHDCPPAGARVRCSRRGRGRRRSRCPAPWQRPRGRGYAGGLRARRGRRRRREGSQSCRKVFA